MKPTIYTADYELTAHYSDGSMHKIGPEAAADELNLLARELAESRRQTKLAVWCLATWVGAVGVAAVICRLVEVGVFYPLVHHG